MIITVMFEEKHFCKLYLNLFCSTVEYELWHAFLKKKKEHGNLIINICPCMKGYLLVHSYSFHLKVKIK